MSLIFEVAEGGALDIDIKIEGESRITTSLTRLIKEQFLIIFMLEQVLMARIFILVKEKAMASTHLQRIWMAYTNTASQTK